MVYLFEVNKITNKSFIVDYTLSTLYKPYL